MLAGADFIKTSTGKVQPAATLPVTLVMLEAVRDFREPTGQMVGVKPAGGIRTTKDAIKYLVMVNEIVGADWLDPDWFRFGASTPAQRPAAAAHQDDAPATTPAPTTSRWTDGSMASTTELRLRVRPGPRVARDRRPQAVLRPVHRRRVRRRPRHAVQDDHPGHRGGPRRGRRGRRRRRRRRRHGRPPRLHPGLVDRCRAPSAPSTSSASPGSSRSAPASSPCWSRSTTASRSRSRRDVDVPLAAAHFFYYAGWADKLEYAGFGTTRAARRRRPGHPVELPAADAGVEDRPGAGLRQHRRAQAGRDHPADRAAVRRDLPAGRPAAGRRQHRHRRRRRPASALVVAPRRRQGRLHRLDRRRQGDRPAPSPAPTRRSPSSSAARPPTSSSTTPRSTRPSRASSTASSSTRATSAAPARGCWCRRPSPTRCSTGSSAGCRRCASATRSTRTPTSARSTPASSCSRIRELSDVGEAEGAERWSAAVRPARRPASGSRRRSSPASPRPTGSPARRSSARCCRC